MSDQELADKIRDAVHTLSDLLRQAHGKAMQVSIDPSRAGYFTGSGLTEHAAPLAVKVSKTMVNVL